MKSSTLSENIENVGIFEKLDYLKVNARLFGRRIMAQLKVIGKLRRRTREAGMRRRIEENLPRRICNAGAIENRN
jgi:hypothetical protein